MSARPLPRHAAVTAVLGLGLGLAPALTGCSDDLTAQRAEGGDVSTPSTTPSETPSLPVTSAPPSEPSGPDAVCGGLELDVVRQVLGPQMKNYLADVDYCIFAGPRHQEPTLIVTAVPTLGDPAEFAQEAKDFCDSGYVEVEGVGDHAWTCNGPTFGPQGYVVDGDAFVELDVASGDDQADLASLLELLPSVVVPTGLEFPE